MRTLIESEIFVVAGADDEVGFCDAYGDYGGVAWGGTSALLLSALGPAGTLASTWISPLVAVASNYWMDEVCYASAESWADAESMLQGLAPLPNSVMQSIYSVDSDFTTSTYVSDY